MASASRSNDFYVSAQEVRTALADVPGLLDETDPDGDMQAALAHASLPGVEPGRNPVEIQPGIVAFEGEHVANVVQTTVGGSRALTVIGDKNVPEEFMHEFDLPVGLALKLAPGGGINLVDEAGNVIVPGFVDVPWALDAENREIETGYRIADRNKLTQFVGHRMVRSTYPVVADPSMWNMPWGGAILTITKNDLYYLANGSSAALMVYLGKAAGAAAWAFLNGSIGTYALDWYRKNGYCLSLWSPWRGSSFVPLTFWYYRC